MEQASQVNTDWSPFSIDPIVERNADEITDWFLIFFPFCKDPLSCLFPGRFKNVTALGFSKSCRTWVLYEFTFRGARIFVLPDTAESLQTLARWTLGSTMLKVEGTATVVWPRWLGLWSVPAVRHLTGSLGAWTPSGLYRRMIAKGAKPIDGSASFTRTSEQ